MTGTAMLLSLWVNRGTRLSPGSSRPSASISVGGRTIAGTSGSFLRSSTRPSSPYATYSNGPRGMCRS